MIIITTGKKDTVICLAGARSLLRPEKSSSHLSGGCTIVITTGKKSSSKVLVLRTYLVYNVQLCCCVSFLVVAGNSLY